MKLNFKLFYTILVVVFIQSKGYSQPGEIDFPGFLKETAKSDEKFWVRIHAAEALISNNFTIDASSVFNAEQLNNGAEKIGVLRVMFRINQTDSIKSDSITKEILHHIHNPQNEHERLVALETLGKLGIYLPDEQILNLAETGNGGMKVFAQWVISNSGNPADMNKLANFLFSNDSIQFRYAAFALRFHEDVPTDVYLKMKDKLKVLNGEHPFRVYLLSALYVHTPEEDVHLFKEKLLDYLNGDVYERYEVYEALAKKGTEEDMAIIRKGFENETNTDVRVAASNAYLTNEHYLQSHIVWVDWLILFAYGVLLVGIGWFYSYRQKNKEDYFLGGRSTSPFLAGISLYVSFFSAITYLAIPGEVIKYGPLFALAAIAGAPLIYLLASYFLIPFFMNLKITSAYEILEKPLGEGIRRVGSFVFILTRFLWMALLLFLASKAMVVMMGWDEKFILIVILILGLITIFYTSMGGLKAVLMTDVIQFFILLLGAVLTIGIVAFKFGGASTLIPTSWSANWDSIDFISFNPYLRLTVFFAFINNITWWLCTTGSDQMAIQRFLSTKDLKSARKTFLHTQIGLVVITTLLMFVGFSVMGFYNIHPNLLPSGTNISVEADFLFPHFIANQFPPGMSGLVIAALFSASMSSLSSGVNSVGSIVTADIIPVLFKNRKNIDTIRNIRVISVLIGIVAILLSLAIQFVPGNIIEVTAKTNGLFIAPLFNLFINALFIKKAKPFGVLMGSFYGFMTAFLIGFWDVLTGNPPLSFLWIAFLSLIVSVMSSLLFNSVLPSVKGKKALVWGLLLGLPWIVLFSVII
jgi:SSS family solute:Na+ symporter